MGNEESRQLPLGNEKLADIASRTIQERKKNHESGERKIFGKTNELKLLIL
jgi:hypothetical protein